MTIRPAHPDDATALSALSAELGYPTPPEAIGDRLGRLLGQSDQLVMVACDGGDAVFGWIHAAEQVLLESDRRSEILGLVVASAHRRQGVGQQLVAAVERWTRARGLVEISVRSNVVRTESHPFYEGMGFTRVKTQHAYRKRIGAAGA